MSELGIFYPNVPEGSPIYVGTSTMAQFNESSLLEFSNKIYELRPSYITVEMNVPQDTIDNLTIGAKLKGFMNYVLPEENAEIGDGAPVIFCFTLGNTEDPMDYPSVAMYISPFFGVAMVKNIVSGTAYNIQDFATFPITFKFY